MRKAERRARLAAEAALRPALRGEAAAVRAAQETTRAAMQLLREGYYRKKKCVQG